MVGKMLTKFEVNWTSTSRENLGGGVILAPRSDTADPNSEVEIGLITDVIEKMLWLANTCLKTDHKS